MIMAISEKALELAPDIYQNDKFRITIFVKMCKSCGLCLEECPKDCLAWGDHLGVFGTPVPKCDIDLCNGCRLCEVICPDCAIILDKAAKTK